MDTITIETTIAKTINCTIAKTIRYNKINNVYNVQCNTWNND